MTTKAKPKKSRTKPAAPRRRRPVPEAILALGWRGGPPAYEDLDQMRSLPGDDGLMFRLVYGASEEEWNKMIERELVDDIAQNPHKFVTKLHPPRRRKN